MTLSGSPATSGVGSLSGHGIGKSALLAGAILWFGFTRQDGKIPATAPTSHQLEDVLAAEVRKWADRMRARGWGYFTRRLSITQEAIRFPSGTFAALRTATKDRPEALQGFHAQDLLFVLDEASGIDDIIFEVAGGALSTRGAMFIHRCWMDQLQDRHERWAERSVHRPEQPDFGILALRWSGRFGFQAGNPCNDAGKGCRFSYAPLDASLIVATDSSIDNVKAMVQKEPVRRWSLLQKCSRLNGQDVSARFQHDHFHNKSGSIMVIA